MDPLSRSSAIFCAFMVLVLICPLKSMEPVAFGQSIQISEEQELTDETLKIPKLPADAAERVSELDGRIKELTKAGSDEDFATAISLAEEVLEIRIEYQGSSSGWKALDGTAAEWYEVADARRAFDDLTFMATLPVELRQDLVEALAVGERVVEAQSSGRIEELLGPTEQACEVCERILGPDHPSTLEAVNNRGEVLYVFGRLDEAELMFRQASVGFRRVLGPDHKNTVVAVNNLGGIFAIQGKHAEAAPILRESLDGCRRILGEDDPLTINTMNNLGTTYQMLSKFDEAEPILTETLARCRRVLGKQHSLTLTVMGNLGLVLYYQGRSSEAEVLLQEAVDANLQHYGDSHPNVLKLMRNLALVQTRPGKLDLAEQCYRDVIQRSRRSPEKHRTSVIDSLKELGRILYRKGDYLEAEETLVEAAHHFEVARAQIGFSGIDRISFASDHSPYRDLVRVLVRNGRSLHAWHSLEMFLSRGLLDSLYSRYSPQFSEDERERERSLQNRINDAESRMNALLDEDNRTRDQETAFQAERQELDQCLADLAAFQSEFNRKHGAITGEVSDLQSIQVQLPDDTALVAWIDYRGGGRAAEDSGEHWACIVRHLGQPVWVSLPGSGPGGAWTADDDELAKRWHNAVSGQARLTSGAQRRTLVRQMNDQRIAPLKSHLEGIRHLVVLPDDMNTGIPLDAVCDDYTVSYAPSGSIYAWLKKRSRTAGSLPISPESLLLLGDPRAQSSVGEQTTASGRRSPTRDSGPDDDQPDPMEKDTPGVGIETGDQRAASFAALAGSRIEVERISDLFQPETGSAQPTVLVGPQATDRHLDELASSGSLRSYRYIHMATHGALDTGVGSNSALLLSSESPPEDADRMLNETPRYDDKLTAAQIIRTWDLDADLVTFSGCSTALGSLRYGSGEGFFGLSQALLIAGARSVVSSLWKVDDMASMLLMVRFYENLFGRFDETRRINSEAYPPGIPIPKAEALHEAKTWLRSLTGDELDALARTLPKGALRGAAATGESVMGQEEYRPFEHPRYWAAFILIGDPD